MNLTGSRQNRYTYTYIHKDTERQKYKLFSGYVRQKERSNERVDVAEKGTKEIVKSFPDILTLLGEGL